MREIKFSYVYQHDDTGRILNKKFDIHEIELELMGECFIEGYTLIARRQYTGLKDKNKEEIYEGDIVIVTEEDEDSCMGREFNYEGVVSYGNSLKLSRYVSQYPFSFCLISKSFYKEQALLFNERWDYEVIGNIYENPELLRREE